MKVEIVQCIAKDLQLPENSIDTAIRTSHARIRRISFNKRNGERRIAYQPAATVKPILSWLRFRVFSLLPVSSIATAYRPGSTILNNAATHRHSRFSVRVDIKDFFPSIVAKDVERLIRESPQILATDWDADDLVELVTQVCFDRLGRLPIGFPTSPDLANAVMYSFDSALSAEISKDALYGAATLTRYADDFVFSTDRPGACAKFVSKFGAMLNDSTSPKLHINEKKTRYMSRAGGSTLITGLRINNQGEVRVHANYRDHVRLLLHHLAANRLALDELAKLAGHMAFIQHADPALFTRLSFRYADQIALLRRKQ